MDAIIANASAPLAASTSLHGALYSIDLPTKLVTTAALLLIPCISYYLRNANRAYSGIPFVGKEKGEWSYKPSIIRWAMKSVDVVKQGMDEVRRCPQNGRDSHRD